MLPANLSPPRPRMGGGVAQLAHARGADVRNGPHSATVGRAGDYRGVSASVSIGAAR